MAFKNHSCVELKAVPCMFSGQVCNGFVLGHLLGPGTFFPAKKVTMSVSCLVLCSLALCCAGTCADCRRRHRAPRARIRTYRYRVCACARKRAAGRPRPGLGPSPRRGAYNTPGSEVTSYADWERCSMSFTERTSADCDSTTSLIHDGDDSVWPSKSLHYTVCEFAEMCCAGIYFQWPL